MIGVDKVIVRDYNGHYRLEQVDLDEVLRARDRLKEIDDLKAQVEYWKDAWEKCQDANVAIGNELNDTRWKLIAAQKQLAALEHIDIDWEVAEE